MVKQGKYAKVSQQKKLQSLRQHIANKGSRVVSDDQLSDFLLVRWHLTNRQPKLTETTMQQFLRAWLEQAQSHQSPWSLSIITGETLQQFNQQVPWQFYAIVNQQFERWQSFLQKEGPTVPLATRLLFTDALSPEQWVTLLSQQLAVNTLLQMTGGNQDRLAQINNEQVAQLQVSFLNADKTAIEWQKVTALAPAKPPVSTDDNRQWLAGLANLTPADF
ncbi:hypothetical protein [Furfurilactobacillus entadae]|uniref:hypothetical protein n=1 Tax=Furfurilactobacillus entadae TaxID=2922307 RepID=UPI0035E52879